MLVRARRYALAVLLTAWAALPVAFWVVRPGDSARHHFQSTIPVALGVGILLARLRAPWRYVALALLAAVNYWAFAPSSSTRVTSGNLIQSGRLTAGRVAVYHRLARDFAERDASRTAFLGTFTSPFAENQVLSVADSVTSVRPLVRFGMDATEIDWFRHGRGHTSSIVELQDGLRPGRATTAVAAGYDDDGYAVSSMELYGDMGTRQRSDRAFRLSELQLGE